MNQISNPFKMIDRANFLTAENKGIENIDAPLSIGFGQTNSQPTTVRLMLEWLDVQPGQKILDVGSGSGWTTALLSHLVGPKGNLYAVEKIPDLVKFGKENCERLKIKNARFFQARQKLGLEEFAPFDRILVSAAANELPKELVEQLKNQGKMVIPIKDSVYIIDKIDGSKYKSTEHLGFAFVPLV